MSEAYIMSPAEFRRFTEEMKETLLHMGREMKGMLVEKPMCTKDAAKYLNIHETTLFRRIRSGSIPSRLVHRIEGTIYFLPSELHQFIKSS